MFENIIQAQDKVWAQLQERKKNLPHALLLSGIRGIGKTELAQSFAKSLLCERPLTARGEACGQCQSCHWFAQGHHPDFRHLSPAALQSQAQGEEGEDKGGEKGKRGGHQITIDQIRELEDFFTVGTHRQGLRITLIAPAEALNHNAANSILKILEEPSPGTLFLLVSNEASRLLPTLRSRCQQVKISPPDISCSQQMLAQAGVTEAETWLALAGNAPGLALELAQEMHHGWMQAVQETLAEGGRLEVLARAALLEKNMKEIRRENPLVRLVECIQKWVIDLNLAAQGASIRFYRQQHATIQALAHKTSPERLVRFYRHLLILRQESRHPLNARLFIEKIFFAYRALFME